MDHYIRTYDPVTDSEEWIGPVSAHMSEWIKSGLEGRCQTRVYRKDELPGVDDWLPALAGEYRESMDAEVLHSWAKDVRAAIQRTLAQSPNM